jgi:hypothetical protein
MDRESFYAMPPTPTTGRLQAAAGNVKALLKKDGVLAALVFLACLIIYLPTLSPSVVLGDGGEMQMLSDVLGVSHPTGYPLFLLLGYLFGHLPLGGDHAFRVTLLSTVCTSGTVALLFLTVRELAGARAPALAAALLACAAPRVWMEGAAADVYALSSFFGILGIWLLLRWESAKTPLWIVGLAFGFGLTHHISLRLFAPAVLVFLLLVEPRLPLRPRRWLPALACLLLPLALYAYVPLRAAHFTAMPELAGRILGVRKVVASGFISPFYFTGGAISLILALGYSGAFLSGGIRVDVIKDYLALAQQQFPLVVVAIALVGVGVLFKRRWRANVLLLIIFAGVLLAALQHLSTVGEDGKHFIPTFLLTAVWFGVGADGIISLLTNRLARHRRWLPATLSIAVCALAVYAVAVQYPEAMKRRQVDVVPGVLDQPLPAGAVLTGDWIYVTPLRYRQRVEGVRPDLWIIHANQDGTSIIMADAIRQHAPLYTIRPTQVGFRLLPLPVWDPSVITHPADAGIGPTVRWRGYDLSSTVARPGDVLPITLYWEATAPVGEDWTTFIHLLDENGEKVGQVDQSPGDGFYPPSAWRPGLLVADQYEFPLDSKLKPGKYRLIFGWYRGGDRLSWNDGQDARELAQVIVEPR